MAARITVFSRLGRGNNHFISKDNFPGLIKSLKEEFSVDLEEDENYEEQIQIRRILNAIEEEWQVRFDKNGDIFDLDFGVNDYAYYSEKDLNNLIDTIAPYVTANSFMMIEEEDSRGEEKILFRGGKFERFYPKIYYQDEEILEDLMIRYGGDITLNQIMTTISFKNSV